MSLAPALCTGLRFSIIFTLLGFAPVLSVAMSAHDQESILQLVDAQIDLEKARLKIMNNAISGTRKPNGPQLRAADFLRRRGNLDSYVIEFRIQNLEILKSEVNSRNDTALVLNNFRLNSGPCSFSKCIQLLGKMNGSLAQQIIDINNHIIIHSMNKITIEKRNVLKDLGDRDNLLNRSVDLELRNFACQRAIGDWSGHVEMNANRMGTCFAALANEAASANGIKPSPIPSPKHFDAPIDDRIPVSDAEAQKLSTFVLGFPNYQVTPWDLYKYCLQEKNGNMVEATSLCYGALRINRMRPDFKRKLLDIRGDRSRGGDNGGDWYHFFGMSRAGMAFGPVAKKIYFVEPNYVLGAVVDFVRNTRRDPIEMRNDLLGADVGIMASQTVTASRLYSAKIPASNSVCTMDIFSFRK